MIKLYYIPGISREDTPVFINDTAQQLFFRNISNDNKLVIQDGFYPPHYQNKVTLELSIVSAGGSPLKWNYLELTFVDKLYYYFIDRIEYVNEDLVNLYITMDTIQTFMFDINFIQSHITRRSIKRWVYDDITHRYFINRDYLRENFSNGKFILKEKKYYTYNRDFSSNANDTSVISGYIYARYPSAEAMPNECHTIMPDNVNFLYSYSTNRTGFVPEILGSLEYPIDWGTPVSFESKDAISGFINHHADKIIFAAYLPFDNVLLGGLVDENYVFNADPGSATYEKDNEALLYKPTVDIITYVLYDDYNTSFLRPTIVNYTLPDFNAYYNPALLDETYYKLTFGEKTVRSQFPLHLSTDKTFRLNYYGDIFTCKRCYYITTEYGLVNPTITVAETGTKRIIGDTYDTLAIANDLVTVDVNNTSFNEYYTYNKASMFMGIASAVLSVAMLFV